MLSDAIVGRGPLVYTPRPATPDAPPPPDDLETFRIRAYTFVLEESPGLAPMIEALASVPDPAPYRDALEKVTAQAHADAPHLQAIDADIHDLTRGGRVSWNSGDLLAHHAPLSPAGKRWIATAPVVTGTLAAYLDGGDCHRHGIKEQTAGNPFMEQVMGEAVAVLGDVRVASVRPLMQLLTRGSPGAGPVHAPDGTGAGEVAAIGAEAHELAARIRAAVAAGKKQGGVRAIDAGALEGLLRAVAGADPRIRDRIYADHDLLHELTQTADAHQVEQLVHAADSVEALVQACLETVHPKDYQGVVTEANAHQAFVLVRDYLVARSGPDQREARMRVLRHPQLKAAALDTMADGDRRLIYRLIARGTMEPTSEDRVHEAAAAGDGVAMARALMQLAGAEPGHLQALAQDQLFWQSLAKLDTDVAVDGITVNPYRLCLTMWGLGPQSTAGDRPLSIDERLKLETELFNPTIRDLESEFAETITDDDDCVEILRSYEAKAARKEYAELLHREGLAPGPALQARFDAGGGSLRGKIQDLVEGNERRECERILGLRLEATVGTLGGVSRLASDRDKGPMQLEQALREVLHEGTPIAQHLSVCVDGILRSTYEQPALGPSQPVYYGSVDDTLDAYRAWTAVFNQHVGELARLSGIPASGLHAIELLANAFAMRAGDLTARMSRCFAGTARDTVLAAMGLRASDRQERAMAAGVELMKSDPAAALALQAETLWSAPARELFTAVATLDAAERVDELSARLAALRAQTLDAPAADAGLPRTFDAYYRREYGIDPQLHLGRVLDALQGKESIAAPSGEAPEITETNRHLVRPGFTAARAEALGRELWQHLHGSGEAHLIMSRLYGSYTPEEQRLIGVAFRQLSGGIDVAFYLQQEKLARQRDGVVKIGGEGIAVSGDDTALETALMVATHGELDQHALLVAAVANRDVGQIFRVVDDCSEADCRKVLADSALMSRLHGVCDQYAWDRVSKTLTGQADLADRLYSRAHGAYDSWNPLDSTDEAGIREDVKRHVQRLRRKLDKEVRSAAQGGDPEAVAEEVKRRVREACHRLMANPDIRQLIEAELSGSDLAAVEGLILDGGDTTTRAQVARGGEDADAIIAGIRALTREQKQGLRQDPEYLDRLARRLPTAGEYREALDLLTSDVEGQGSLTDLDKAVSDGSTDARAALRGLIALGEAEYRQLAADPALQARLLAAVDDEQQRALVRRVLSLRLSDDKAGADDYLEHNAVSRLQLAMTLGWDTVLAQCVEIYKLEPAPGKETREKVWNAVAGDVGRFARRAAVDASRHTRSTLSARQMITVIEDAVLGHRDPSNERLRENLGTSYQQEVMGQQQTVQGDNDHAGLLATINAASPALLIGEWSSIAQERPDGGASMRAVYQEFLQSEAALGESATPAERADQERKKLAFLSYVPGISLAFETLLLPFVGSEHDQTARGQDPRLRAGLATRDNKKYNELLDAVSARIAALPKSHGKLVAAAIGAVPEHERLIDNQNRDTLSQASLREQRYLEQRGTQAGSGWAASNEAAALDQAMVRYGRETAMAQITVDGQEDAYGLITAGEGARIEEKGAEVERALVAFKDAKAKVAMWMSLIIGTLVTCILTVLTGGAATSFSAMLFFSALTAGASATAKAAINEAVLGADNDFTDEGLASIGKEMLTAVITAGTTFIAQKMLAAVSGATSLARQARAAEQTLRIKPPLWKGFLDEASEEVLSETMSGTIEAGLVAIDPTHWMHGVVEGRDRALPQAWARLKSVPKGALNAALTSVITSGMSKLVASKAHALHDIAHANKKVDVRKNFAEVFGDQRESVVATFVEWSMAKLGGEKIDLENVPGELLEGYLQEMNEKSVEMHTRTADRGRRGRRAQQDLGQNGVHMTAEQRADFLAMNEEAQPTDPYVSAADYLAVRQKQAGHGASPPGSIRRADEHALSEVFAALSGTPTGQASLQAMIDRGVVVTAEAGLGTFWHPGPPSRVNIDLTLADNIHLHAGDTVHEVFHALTFEDEVRIGEQDRDEYKDAALLNEAKAQAALFDHHHEAAPALGVDHAETSFGYDIYISALESARDLHRKQGRRGDDLQQRARQDALLALRDAFASAVPATSMTTDPETGGLVFKENAPRTYGELYGKYWDDHQAGRPVGPSPTPAGKSGPPGDDGDDGDDASEGTGLALPPTEMATQPSPTFPADLDKDGALKGSFFDTVNAEDTPGVNDDALAEPDNTASKAVALAMRFISNKGGYVSGRVERENRFYRDYADYMPGWGSVFKLPFLDPHGKPSAATAQDRATHYVGHDDPTGIWQGVRRLLVDYQGAQIDSLPRDEKGEPQGHLGFGQVYAAHIDAYRDAQREAQLAGKSDNAANPFVDPLSFALAVFGTPLLEKVGINTGPVSGASINFLNDPTQSAFRGWINRLGLGIAEMAAGGAVLDTPGTIPGAFSLAWNTGAALDSYAERRHLFGTDDDGHGIGIGRFAKQKGEGARDAVEGVTHSKALGALAGVAGTGASAVGGGLLTMGSALLHLFSRDGGPERERDSAALTDGKAPGGDDTAGEGHHDTATLSAPDSRREARGLELSRQLSSDLLALTEGTADAETRERIATQLRRQVADVALTESVSEGARSVVSVVTPGGGPMGIKTMNDELIGNQLVSLMYMPKRDEAIRRVFEAEGMRVVEQSYKTTTLTSPLAPSQLPATLDRAMARADAEMRVVFEAALRRGRLEWDKIAGSGVGTAEHAEATKRLGKIDKALLSVSDRDRVALEVGVAAVGEGGADHERALMAKMDATKAALMGRDGQSAHRNVAGEDARVTTYDEREFREFTLEGEALKKEIMRVGNRITLRRGEGAPAEQLVIFDADGLPSPAVLRDVRKGKLTPDMLDPAERPQLELFMRYFAHLNAFDYMKEFTASEVAAAGERVGKVRDVLHELGEGKPVATADVRRMLTEDVTGNTTPQQGKASEAVFYERASQGADRLVVNADVKDLAVELLRGYAATQARVADGGDLRAASLEADDPLLKFKRHVVASLRAAYDRELSSAIARHRGAGRERLARELETEREPAFLLGGDEITLSLHPALQAHLPAIVGNLMNEGRARVAVTRTDGAADGHEAAMKAADPQHAILKQYEAVQRQLADLAAGASLEGSRHAHQLIDALGLEDLYFEQGRLKRLDTGDVIDTSGLDARIVEVRRELSASAAGRSVR